MCLALSRVISGRGGKGGFGSLLRGSRKASQTENDDAYRDLSGRRLRIVNAEKKLQEWAGAEEQRKKEKQEAKLERERAKAERRAESSQVNYLLKSIQTP